MAIPFAAIGAAASIAGSIFGVVAGDQKDKNEREAVRLAHQRDMANWNFAKNERKSIFNYEKDAVNIARKNNEACL